MLVFLIIASLSKTKLFAGNSSKTSQYSFVSFPFFCFKRTKKKGHKGHVVSKEKIITKATTSSKNLKGRGTISREDFSY